MELIRDWLHCGKLEFSVPFGFSLHQGQSTEELAKKAAEHVGLEVEDADLWQIIACSDKKIVRLWEAEYAYATEEKATP